MNREERVDEIPGALCARKNLTDGVSIKDASGTVLRAVADECGVFHNDPPQRETIDPGCRRTRQEQYDQALRDLISAWCGMLGAEFCVPLNQDEV